MDFLKVPMNILLRCLTRHTTPCPNPFIAELVNESVDDDQYQREPFAADVSESRIIFNAHSYH